MCADKEWDIKKYKKGERIDLLSEAGEDMEIYTKYGISAEVFEQKDHYAVPLITSNRPGSGKFDSFLQELKDILNDKPIIVKSAMNQGILKHLRRNGIKYESI